MGVGNGELKIIRTPIAAWCHICRTGNRVELVEEYKKDVFIDDYAHCTECDVVWSV